MNNNARRLKEIITRDEQMMAVLRAVRTLRLPDWWIGAGFVRSKVWDVLHGRTERTPIDDIDVAYFDPNNLDEAQEKRYDAQLAQLVPAVARWSCKNQARMQYLPSRPPYTCTKEALADWVETATTVAVCLDEHDQLQILAPYGLDDLFDLVVRPTKNYVDSADFNRRYREKHWLEKWPRLKVID